MKSLAQMRSDGIDIDGAMERFMGNEEMFRQFLKELSEESAYAVLCEAIRKAEVEEAFEQAHRLKGILGNLGLCKPYNALYDIVECLRDGELPEQEEFFIFQQVYEDAVAYIAQI